MRENYLKKFFAGNAPKIILTIIILIIIGLIVYNFFVSQLQQQVKVSYDNLQKECATQAKKLTDETQSTTSTIIYNNTSHYSSQLRKCFALIHGEGVAGIGASDILVDISGNKDVANCESYTTAPEMNNCIYNGSAGVYSIDNFKNFVKSYMEAK
jgi:uncharacterized membrane protein YwzB